MPCFQVMKDINIMSNIKMNILTTYIFNFMAKRKPLRSLMLLLYESLNLLCIYKY